MSRQLSIGDFARATHLSIKALRHYHELGLLEPSAVDPQSGYRYYSPDQIGLAMVVRRLRDLGMPLDQVKAVVEAPEPSGRNAGIAAHLDRMERQLAETRRTVADLRALLRVPPPLLPVSFRTIPPAEVLAIRATVSVAEFPQWWADAFAELAGLVGTAALHSAGSPGALYAGDLFESETGEVTAFVPVQGPMAAAGRVQRETIPAIEAAVAVHDGPMAQSDLAYGSIGAELADLGLIGLPGPIREYYPVGPLDTADESRHRTEVCWPVFRTAA